MRPMIFDTRLLLYRRDPEADRAFLRDALGLSHVDSDREWLMFALPPPDSGVHPADSNSNPLNERQNLATRTLCLMWDKLAEVLNQLESRGVEHPSRDKPRGAGQPAFACLEERIWDLYKPSHRRAVRRTVSP